MKKVALKATIESTLNLANQGVYSIDEDAHRY